MRSEETIQVNYRLRSKGVRRIESAYKSWVEASSDITPYVAASDFLNHEPSLSELLTLKEQAKTKLLDYLRGEESRKAYQSMVDEALTSENITI